MTSRIKHSLLLAVGVLTLGIFLWMRSLASWRPVKVGTVAPNRSVSNLARDGKTALIWGSVPPFILNIESGQKTSWPHVNTNFLGFSPSSPRWAFFLNFTRQKELEVREIQTARLKRTFRWPKSRFNTQLVFDGQPDNIGIVDGVTFQHWNIPSGQILHKLQLDVRTLPGDSPSYALSKDGTELVGCSGDQGRVWNTTSGKLLRSWKLDSTNYGFPTFFSDDARVVAYTYTSSTEVQPPLVFVDTTTGKVRWKTKENPTPHYRTGDELVVPDATGCAILDINTGLPKRHLPGPLTKDRLLLATPEYIYTLNDKREILRWRAR